MNIVFADQAEANVLRQKYTLLELDTLQLIQFNGIEKTAWCLLEKEHLSLTDLVSFTKFQDLHHNLVKNYKKKNWKFCEDALEHLIGRWNGEIDSFYFELQKRIKDYKVNDPGPEWRGQRVIN